MTLLSPQQAVLPIQTHQAALLSLAHQLCTSLTQSFDVYSPLTHPLTHSLTRSLAHSLTHSLTPLTHSLHSLTHSTHSFTHSHTHQTQPPNYGRARTHSLVRYTHSPTHSHSLSCLHALITHSPTHLHHTSSRTLCSFLTQNQPMVWSHNTFTCGYKPECAMSHIWVHTLTNNNHNETRISANCCPGTY